MRRAARSAASSARRPPAARRSARTAAAASKAASSPSRPARRGGGRQRRRLGAALGEDDLQHERLVEAQPVAARGVRRPRLAAGGSAGAPPAAAAARGAPRTSRGQRVGHRSSSQCRARSATALRDLPGRQLRGRRVDRDQAAGERRSDVARRRRAAPRGWSAGSLPLKTLDLAGEAAPRRPGDQLLLASQRWLKNVRRSGRPAVGDDDVELVQLGAGSAGRATDVDRRPSTVTCSPRRRPARSVSSPRSA